MGSSATLLHHIPACEGGVETGVVLGAGLPVGLLAFQECALHKLGDWLVCACSHPGCHPESSQLIPFLVHLWMHFNACLSCLVQG